MTTTRDSANRSPAAQTVTRGDTDRVPRKASHYDVIIVGAGPAGSAAASFLREAGIEVLVIERSRFPRDKPCADYVAPGAATYLRHLGVLDELRLRAAPVHAIEITSAGYETMRGDLGATSGFAIPRRDFDSVLLARAGDAGADIRTRTRVEGVQRIPDGRIAVSVRSHDGETAVERARVVIGADGLRSVVARSFSGPTPQRTRRMALVAHLADVDGLHPAGEMFVNDGGYAGVVPLPGGLANVAVVFRTGAAVRGQTAEEMFWKQLSCHAELFARIPRREIARKVLAVGPFDRRWQRVVADGRLLIGDAAQFFDPFTGDGITTALRSARMAADALTEPLLDRGPVSGDALARYEADFRRAFGPRWRAQRALGWAIDRPPLFGRLTARLSRRPDVAGLCAQVAGGVVPLKSLFHPRAIGALLL